MILHKVQKELTRLFGYPNYSYNDSVSRSYWETRRKTPTSTPSINNFQSARASLFSQFASDPSSLLDVGTGDAAQLLAIKSKHPDLSLYACDNDLTYQSIFDLYPDFSFQQTTSLEQLQDYFSRCSPQYISFFEVLEHIPECETYLLSSLKAASKGVFFSVPNSGYLVHRIRFLFGRTPCQWIIRPSEHVRFWTLSDMSYWLYQYLQLPQSIIIPYMGPPILARLFPSLFCKGLFVFIPL